MVSVGVGVGRYISEEGMRGFVYQLSVRARGGKKRASRSHPWSGGGIVGGSPAGRPLKAHSLGTATSWALAAARGQKLWGLQEGAQQEVS